MDRGEVRNYRDATTSTASWHISVASPSVSRLSSSVQDEAAARQDSILDPSRPEALQLVRAATSTTLPTRKPHEIEYMRHEGVFTKLPDDVCDELIGCYFQHVHFFLPILDVPKVLNEYWSRGSKGINPLLLWSMFLAAANFIDGITLEKAGFSSKKAMKTVMYYRAKCLYYFDSGTNILDIIRAVILLAFWHSDPQDYMGAWCWIGVAISLAQAINLHRDPANTKQTRNLFKVSEPMARRIWWSLVVGDRWIAAANGRPMRLRSDGHDLPRPSRYDVLPELRRVNPEARSEFIFANESEARSEFSLVANEARLAELWLRMVRVSDALGDVLQLHHRVRGPEPCIQKVNQLLCQLNEGEFAYSSSSDDDDVHVHTVQVEMLYQATIAMLCRPYVLNATSTFAADEYTELKQSFLRRGREAASSTNELVEQLIEMNALEFMKPMMCVSCDPCQNYPNISAKLLYYRITAMVPASQFHLADCQSESISTRRQGRNKLQLCVNVFAQLRSTYWSADVMYRLFKRAQDLATGESIMQPTPREAPRRPGTPVARQRAAQRMHNVNLMASNLVSAAAALPPIVPITPGSTGPALHFGDVDQLLSPEFAPSEDVFRGLLPNYPIGNYI
ncbi:Cutinase transcription factor 1 beta [Beauveria bassiana]|nr:Cutinase transcription factor 1 beta [Beauveria bassiana]